MPPKESTAAMVQRLLAEGMAAERAEMAHNNQGNTSNNTNGTNSNSNNQGGCTYKIETREVDKVKFASCTLSDSALTWWNDYAASVGLDQDFGTPWEDFRQRMIEEYCPRNEILRMERELHELKLVGTNLVSYNKRFFELALMCPELVPTERRKVEQYIEGLTGKIRTGVTTSKPKTVQEAIDMANLLLDQAASDNKMVVVTPQLGNGNLMKADQIYRGCTFNLTGKSFSIDVMPIKLGSFDLVIGMDWLSENRADIAEDALSRKEKVKPLRVRALNMTVRMNLTSQIRNAQLEALMQENIAIESLKGLDKQFAIRDDETHYFAYRICVPKFDGLKELVLDEAHKSRYSIHPGSEKCIKILRHYIGGPI
ncbi:uncharacterized protein [Rutidosis leptorrhynchoides]|uniref:uncharacterized protein n=1 Tax=Rutidosis leptorrhynchoides TaxID=125765 RepID=UPI003A9919A1